jgi:hypothetical protein
MSAPTEHMAPAAHVPAVGLVEHPGESVDSTERG